MLRLSEGLLGSPRRHGQLRHRIRGQEHRRLHRPELSGIARRHHPAEPARTRLRRCRFRGHRQETGGDASWWSFAARTRS